MTLQIVAVRTFVYLLGLIALLVTTQTKPAVACAAPHIRVFPVCEFSTPRGNERVTAIYAHGGKGLASVALGSDDLVTEVVDVEIEAAKTPHYIALSSGKPIIWRFTGRVDTISRVVVFGSQLISSNHAGIVGIERSRILFTKADMDGLRKVPLTSCHSSYNACELSTYFDIPKASRMKLAGPEPTHRLRVVQFAEQFTAGTISVPRDGWVAAAIPDDRAPNHTLAIGRHELFGGNDYLRTSQAHERGTIGIDTASVVSQQNVSEYRTLPATAGIKQLLGSGALVSAGTPQFASAYEKWNDSLSRLYRSHLDPSFSFNYRVDYLVTQPARLPAALRPISFLVAEGLETPQLGGGSLGACLFFADQRELTLDRRVDPDPRCDRISISALRGPQSNLASITRSLDRMKQWSELEKEKCRKFSFPGENPFFVGIAAKDLAGWGAPGAASVRRQVDVIVKRPGKIALYLEMWGGAIDWYIRPTPSSEITAVLLGSLDSRDRRDAVHGVASTVPVQSIIVRPPPINPRPSAECYNFSPSRTAHLGGPAALALDEGLKVLAGRGLNRLLRVTNEGDWPPITADGPRLTFVIE